VWQEIKALTFLLNREHEFLCDGPAIDNAEAHKTEQRHEVGDRHPLDARLLSLRDDPWP
jgi:hypothetical protein